MSASSTDETLRPFNADTMSGVAPGTRTAVYHRLRIVEQSEREGHTWYSLFWHPNPDRVLVFDLLLLDQNDSPLLELSPATGHAFLSQLLKTTSDRKWQARICGTCHFWQMLAEHAPDELPFGICTWKSEDSDKQFDGESTLDAEAISVMRTQLTTQSCLALECTAWTARADLMALLPYGQAPVSPEGERTGRDEQFKPSFLQRVKQWFRHQPQTPPTQSVSQIEIVERSGVGAGTEPCPICHGRIANLGSTSVTAPEGDEETLSVWRCRNCHTLYLSDWIDRWGSTASLETEETLYRISPMQAAQALYTFEPRRFGDPHSTPHPSEVRREIVLNLVHGAQPVVRQKKQGR